jgi:hypothetical protein
MFRIVGARQLQADKVGGGAAAKPNVPDPQKVADSAMEKILAFVPAEIIGIYVAIFGIAAPKSANGKWVIYALCIAVLLAVMVFKHLLGQKKKEPVPNWWRLLVLMALALVAFTTWAAAMPDTPFLAWHPRATMAAGIVAPILALLMPMIAELCDIAPRGQTTAPVR